MESEKALQWRTVGHKVKGRTVNIKKTLHVSIIVPTLMYRSEIWTWSEGQRFRSQAVEISYLRSVCDLNRMDSKNSGSVYGKFSMAVNTEEINCRVMGVVKCSTLRWFGHLERMRGDEMTKRVYKNGVDAV